MMFGENSNSIDCAFIDREEIMQRVDGNLDLLSKIVQLYNKAIPGFVERIETGIESNNGEIIKNVSHNLKGMISNFAAPAAVKAANALELAGESCDFIRARSLFQELKSELERLDFALQNLATSRH